MNNYANVPNSSKTQITANIAVVGGSGYSGLELLRILKKHPAIGEIATFGSKDSHKLFDATTKFDVVFLATPAEASLDLAPKLLALGSTVIDLSGAFRLNTANILGDYLQWYKMEHTESKLVEAAHYGLVPWATPSNNASGAKLIANPGCYATAVLMALLPLLKNKVIDSSQIVIDAKSGTTGAGKKADEGLIFSEVDGECLPYKVGAHQHLPEITLIAEKLTQAKIAPHFSTHLLPVRRGIIAGIYGKLAKGKNVGDVEQAFREYYAHYPLVKFSNGTSKDLVSLKKVVGTPSTHISYVVDGDKFYLFSTLDNLLKGAASQAVENFNLLKNLPVTTGLEYLESII